MTKKQTYSLSLFQEPLFVARFFYDLLFFFIIIIIILNLIFGVIIDTFADLRSEKQQKDEILRNTCFICGKDQILCFIFHPFPNKPLFSRVCSTSLLKTQWERKKLLVTSNFSFSHSVFYAVGELLTISIKSKIVICKKVLKLDCFNPLLHRYSFYRDLQTGFENIVGKEEILVTSNFFFSHNVFYSIREMNPHLSIFLTSYLYLMMNLKSLKLAYEEKG